jgi:hypothetical protein
MVTQLVELCCLRSLRARSSVPFALLVLAGACRCATVPARQIQLEVLDETGAPLPSRVHLKDARDQPVFPKGVLANSDHFVFSGRTTIELADGTYHYEIERGPEYAPARGTLVVDTRASALSARLTRIDELAKKGWYSGDLHVHRRTEDMQALMRAEDLHVAPTITWGNDRRDVTTVQPFAVFDGNRVADDSAGEDERFGGALLYFGLSRPLELPPNLLEKGKIVHREGNPGDEVPSPLSLALTARSELATHVAIEKPFWWDTPTWIALGVADSMGIAHNHMNRSVARNHEAWGRSCDRSLYGNSPLASAYCTQDIYYRVLDAGIRLAPSAGSASGVLPNPVGHNRVYVHLDGGFNYEKWWAGLKAGESFVTNGPLLLVQANGRNPGYVFKSTARGEPIAVDLSVLVESSLPIRSVELVRDGKVVAHANYDAKTGNAAFARQEFTRSGWFLVRALCDTGDIFRFASSAPYYVEIGSEARRISRAAVAYFSAWLEERVQRLREKGEHSEALEPIIREHQAAQQFYSDQLGKANAD